MKAASLHGTLLGRKRKLPDRAQLLSRPHAAHEAAPAPDGGRPEDRHLPPRDTALHAHPQADLSYPFSFKAKSEPHRDTPAERAPGPRSDGQHPGADHPHRIRVSLRLDPERHLRLKLLSSFSRRSQQSLLTEALDRLLESAPHGFVGAVLTSQAALSNSGASHLGDAAEPAAAGNQPGTEKDGSGA